MFLCHGGRPTKGNGRKRKGVDEYAAENRVDFTSRSIIRDGQLVRILVCRFCCQSIGARSDRIKEHLASKRHQKLKLEAFREAAEAGRDLGQEYSDDSVSGLLPEPPITMLKFPGKALAHLFEGEGRHGTHELTPEAEDRKPVGPTPPPLKEHFMNSPPQLNNQAQATGLERSGGGNSVRGAGSPTPSVGATTTGKEGAPQQLLCVRWGNFDSNIVSMLSKLRSQEHFVDVTLWCEGRTVKCHKIILSACSTYFEQLLTENPNPHPIIFLKDMRLWEIQALVEFMYKGEVSIHQDKLQSLLRAAESLQIKGLGSPSNEIAPTGSWRPSATDDEELGTNMDITTPVSSSNISNRSTGSHQSLLLSGNNSHTPQTPQIGIARSDTSILNSMTMGIDLSNHGPSPSGGIPSKRRKKETPRRIDIPRGALPPLNAYQSSISEEVVDDDDAASDDSMTAHERNHVDDKNTRRVEMVAYGGEEGEEDSQEEGGEGQEDYGDMDMESVNRAEDESYSYGLEDEEMDSAPLSLTTAADLREERERSRKGNPIKKIQLAIGNNNNNETGGSLGLQHDGD